MAKTDHKYNWTLVLGRFNESWGYQYLYSLYFACTSMFTAGYGDITPKNPAEILTILVVQVVGKNSITKVSLTWATLSTKSAATSLK